MLAGYIYAVIMLLLDGVSSSAQLLEGASVDYIHKKLEHGLGRIWTDVQQKVKVFVSSTDLSSFKYDDFIQVLDIVNR